MARSLWPFRAIDPIHHCLENTKKKRGHPAEGESASNKVGERMDQVKDGAKACGKVLSEGLNRIKNLFD